MFTGTKYIDTENKYIINLNSERSYLGPQYFLVGHFLFLLAHHPPDWLEKLW